MAKKVILIILGVLLGLCGIASICFGGIFLGVGGTSGSFKSDYHTISTPTVGFVSDPAKVENSQDTTVSGNVTLKIDARNATQPLFFGVGPTSQVDAYLSGAPHEQVTGIDFSPFKITSSTVSGTTKPAAPGDQAFWVAKATGSNPSLSWKIASGDYEAVLMNADASPTFQADTRLGVDAPILGRLGIGGLIVGIIAALGGLALLIWGIRTRRAVPAAANPYPASYGPSTGYPPTGGYPPPTGYQPPPGYGQQPPAGYEPPPAYGQPGAYPPAPGAYPPISTPPATTPPISTPPATTPPPAGTPPPVPPPPEFPQDPFGTPDSPSPWQPPDDPTSPPKP